MENKKYSNQTLFVANRGEICRRIVRTANNLGIKTIVPLLPENKTIPYYAEEAKEVIYYNSNNPEDSYLSINQTVKLVKDSNSTLVHPGYGFLSENAEFVISLKKENIKFIGPTAETMERLGSKTNAKYLAKENNIPIIEGLEVSDLKKLNINEFIKDIKSKVDFPLIIKASDGGGGRGMRVVNKEEDLLSSLSSASEESFRAFGSRNLFIEKYISHARHIEIQIIGDEKGNIVHLYERDCSIQRKFQKIIEISPAQNLKEEIKLKLYESSIKLAKASHLTNAATFEFLVDTSTDNYFFIESNPRLQVEHTITEEITGIDIVEQQIKVALGEELPKQNQINKTKVCIQARVCGEIPEQGFIPASGRLVYYKPLINQSNIRVDSGYKEGEVLNTKFDSLIQKSISSGDNFHSARNSLLDHLRSLSIYNIGTNISFLIDILNELEWKIPTTTWLESTLVNDVFFELKKQNLEFKVAWFIKEDLKKERTSFLPSPTLIANCPNFNLLGIREDVSKCEKIDVIDILNTEDILCMSSGYTILISRPVLSQNKSINEVTESDKYIKSPLPGKILNIAVKKGDIISKGSILLKLDSMKTEHTINAKFDCIIEEVQVKEGDQVTKGKLLLTVE